MMTNKEFKRIRDKIDKPRKWLSYQLGISTAMVSYYAYSTTAKIPEFIAKIMEELESEC